MRCSGFVRLAMSPKPIKLEIIENASGRFLIKTYADGTEERQAIVKQPRKKRYPERPYWVWKFEKDGNT